MTVEARELDVTRLRAAWEASEANARAQEQLAEHATAAAKAAASAEWWRHPAIWFAAGGLLIGGAAIAGAVALGALDR